MFLKLDSFRLIILVLLTLFSGCKDEPAFEAVNLINRQKINIKHLAELSPEISPTDTSKNLDVNAIILDVKEEYPNKATFYFYTPDFLDEFDIKALSEFYKKLISPNYKKLVVNLSTEEFYDSFTEGFYAAAVISEGKVEIIKINSWFDKLMNFFYL